MVWIIILLPVAIAWASGIDRYPKDGSDGWLE